MQCSFWTSSWVSRHEDLQQERIVHTNWKMWKIVGLDVERLADAQTVFYSGGNWYTDSQPSKKKMSISSLRQKCTIFFFLRKCTVAPKTHWNCFFLKSHNITAMIEILCIHYSTDIQLQFKSIPEKARGLMYP